MSTDDGSRLATRLEGVERRRRLNVVAGLLSSVAVGQLFFAAFAFGHARGPLPLRAIEVLAGMSGALFLSLLVARLMRRSRLEKTADRVLDLREGRHRRRVVLYPDYFVLDREVVLFASVQTADVEERKLLLRYLDPRHSGPVLRELSGSREALSRFAERLVPKPAA